MVHRTDRMRSVLMHTNDPYIDPQLRHMVATGDRRRELLRSSVRRRSAGSGRTGGGPSEMRWRLGTAVGGWLGGRTPISRVARSAGASVRPLA